VRVGSARKANLTNHNAESHRALLGSRIERATPKKGMSARAVSRFNRMGTTVPWGGFPDRERVMTRIIRARGLAGWLVMVSLSSAVARAQDQPPALDPPALLPPATAPVIAPAPATAPARAGAPSGVTPARPAENRSLLVIPGVTAPAPPRPGAVSPALRAPSTTTVSPKPARSAQSLARPAPGPPAPIPLSLEAIPDDPPAEMGAERVPPNRSDRARPSRAAPPRNSSNPFGRVLGPVSPNEDIASPRRSSAAEPRSDPAVDAALKRRIEKQVEQALGDRVRSVEVRVTGKTVVFRAHASRFWYRRSVRRSLETMPLPSGYRAHVEAVD
jgi:hypothetical protein